MLAACNKHQMRFVSVAVLNLVGIFENYVIPAFIAYGIAEVFVAGTKLKEEQDLTI